MNLIFGLLCGVAALALTFFIRIQRGQLRNNLWDAVVVALCIASGYLINPLGNEVLSGLGGLAVGVVAVVIRDFRLWLARASDRRRPSRRDRWYGRARDWWYRRRR